MVLYNDIHKQTNAYIINIKTKETKMTKFYIEHKINLHSDSIYEDLKYNSKLLTEYYFDGDEEFEDRGYIEVSYALHCYHTYFEPLVFDEEIALAYDLIPFTYKGKNMLAITRWGIDLSKNSKARREAYQALDSYKRLINAYQRLSKPAKAIAA